MRGKINGVRDEKERQRKGERKDKCLDRAVL